MSITIAYIAVRECTYIGAYNLHKLRDAAYDSTRQTCTAVPQPAWLIQRSWTSLP